MIYSNYKARKGCLMKKYLERMYADGKNCYFSFLSQRLISAKKTFIVTANPEILAASKKDKAVSDLLDDPETSIVPDGISVVFVCNKKGYSVKERIPGIDICSFLLEEANRQKKTVFLLGAKPDVSKRLAETVSSKYPDLTLLGAVNGYVDSMDAIFDEIVSLSPDICMVALGVPAQEKLIYKHLHRFDKGIFVGVGGSFDVISGAKRRAPDFFIKHNIEWLYRIIKEPRRLKRFFTSNIRFIMETFMLS